MRSIESRFEGLLFASRWLAAPIYLGLVFALVMLLVVFARQLWAAALALQTMTLDDAVLARARYFEAVPDAAGLPNLRVLSVGPILADALRAMAAAGADRISVGALTHSAPAATLSLVLKPVTVARRRPR